MLKDNLVMLRNIHGFSQEAISEKIWYLCLWLDAFCMTNLPHNHTKKFVKAESSNHLL